MGPAEQSSPKTAVAAIQAHKNAQLQWLGMAEMPAALEAKT
jgi:hypothetical protein